MEWGTPAYLVMESATPLPVAHKHSLQYDKRPDWHCGVRVWKWNIDSLSGKGEVCEEVRKRMIGVLCLQEVRWRG